MLPALSGESPSVGMRDALKAATRDRHAALDAAAGFSSDTIDRAAYRRFLARLACVLIPLEARVHQVPGFHRHLPDLAQRRKAPALASDLAALGDFDDLGDAGDGQALADPAEVVRPADLPVVTSIAAAWGCSYVLEGATLGGAALARRLGPTLGLPPGRGLSYWTIYGGQTGARWQRFVRDLEAWAASGAAVTKAEAVHTAVATFDAFLKVFAAHV